jgi:hypothetical protein
MTTFVVRLSEGKLQSSKLDGQRFDLSTDGYRKLAQAMIDANEGSFCMMRSSSLDFPEEEGGDPDVDYGDLVMEQLGEILAELQPQNSLVPIPIIECSCCNCYHRSAFRGDCRDDEAGGDRGAVIVQDSR